jgi:predicted amidophosphoribosyltransferase
MKCKRCGEVIDSMAGRCPECGLHNRHRFFVDTDAGERSTSAKWYRCSADIGDCGNAARTLPGLDMDRRFYR